MLFQGEEYGERAPFQFFSDHIDEEIAVATRDGRRREFASFASFAGEVPDPQDPATFERSKLTREGRPGVRELYERLLAARRTLGDAETEATGVSEEERWLRVVRGGHVLAMNFSRDAERRVPVDGSEVVVSTHDVRVEDGAAVLPPLSGALVR